MKFQYGGPPRYDHQKRALRRIIETRGICALLLDPGLGKSAVVIDYLSLLALKTGDLVDGEQEVRALVLAPKAAVDTWAIQAETFASPLVGVWAEVLGGSIAQKAEALISRGPEPYTPRSVRRLKDRVQAQRRALNADRAELIYSTNPDARGPSEVTGRPRLVITVANLDMLSSRSRRGSGTMADYIVACVKRYRPHVIVIDESHRIKGVSSNVSRLAARLSDTTPRRLMLTGTVMPHSPMDVFAQWRFLAPYAFGQLDSSGKRSRASYAAFQRRYAITGGYMGREVVAFQRLDEMQDVMAQNSIVVRKEDALDLPEMTDAVVPIVLSSREQAAYDQMTQQLVATVGGTTLTAGNRLTQMLRLRQITAGHLPDDQGVVHTVGTSKIDSIRSLVQDTLAGEKRVVIFTVFRQEIAELRQALAEKGTEIMVIDGSVPNDRRLALRKRFGSSDPARIVLIAQVQTISLAVNELVTASHAIFATLSQRRDDLVQARDRLNRIGQTRPCTFWYVLARGTVDEVIYKSHRDRTDLEAAILAHVQSAAQR